MSKPLVPVEERFWKKVDKHYDGCWLWTGYKNQYGYGLIGVRVDGRWKMALVHRLSYEWSKGEIPAGMQVDHVCRARACVNPEHLRVASNADNHHNLARAGRRGASGFRRVSWSAKSKKWQVHVTVYGRQHYLGVYADEEQAARVAADFRREHMPFSAEDARDAA